MALLLRKNGVIAQPYLLPKPMKFKGYLIPEYFVADFYFVDNDGINPKNDASRFPTWSVLTCLLCLCVCVCARARANYLHVGLADSLSSLSFSLYTRGGMT